MSHSPGPWTWAYNQSCILEDSTGKRLFEITPRAIFNMAPKDSLLIAAAPRLLKMLRKLEWTGAIDGVPACPVCRRYAPQFGGGHVDCELAALLEELK